MTLLPIIRVVRLRALDTDPGAVAQSLLEFRGCLLTGNSRASFLKVLPQRIDTAVLDRCDLPMRCFAAHQIQNRFGDEAVFFRPEFDDRPIAPNGDVMDSVCCARIGSDENIVIVGAAGGLDLGRFLLRWVLRFVLFRRAAVRVVALRACGRFNAGAYGREQQRENRRAISVLDRGHEGVGDAGSGTLIEPPLDSDCQQKQADPDKRAGRQFIHHKFSPRPPALCLRHSAGGGNRR